MMLDNPHASDVDYITRLNMPERNNLMPRKFDHGKCSLTMFEVVPIVAWLGTTSSKVMLQLISSPLTSVSRCNTAPV
jgi:hypothetical protein